jgi:hypothetical protein
VVTTQGPIAGRDVPGVIDRDIDIELLSLVSTGCDVDQIRQRLRLPLRDVHRRLVHLRHVIEDVSRSSSPR